MTWERGQNALHKWEMRVSKLGKGLKCSTQVEMSVYSLEKGLKCSTQVGNEGF